MKQQSIFTQTAIISLKSLQDIEAAANFPNGDYWNELEDKITNLELYGQVEDPEEMYDNNGYRTGYRLKDGTEVIESGMSVNDDSQYH